MRKRLNKREDRIINAPAIKQIEVKCIPIRIPIIPLQTLKPGTGHPALYKSIGSEAGKEKDFKGGQK